MNSSCRLVIICGKSPRHRFLRLLLLTECGEIAGSLLPGADARSRAPPPCHAALTRAGKSPHLPGYRTPCGAAAFGLRSRSYRFGASPPLRTPDCYKGRAPRQKNLAGEEVEPGRPPWHSHSWQCLFKNSATPAMAKDPRRACRPLLRPVSPPSARGKIKR